MKTIKFIAIALCICMAIIPMMVMAEDPIMGEVTPELTEAPIIKETPIGEVTPELTEIPVVQEPFIPAHLPAPSELKLTSQTTDRKLFTITLSNFGEKEANFNELKSKYSVSQREAKIQDPEKSIIGKIIDIVNPNTLSQNEEVTLDITVDGSGQDLYFDDYWLLIRNN